MSEIGERVARLEARFDGMSEDVHALREDMKATREDVSAIRDVFTKGKGAWAVLTVAGAALLGAVSFFKDQLFGLFR